MKPFDQWFNEAWKTLEVKEPELPEDVSLIDGKYMAVCRSCDNSYELDCSMDDILTFDKNMSYCGRSERCCP